MFWPKQKFRLIWHELRHHLPFTVIGVLASLLFLGIIHWFLLPATGRDEAATHLEFFHFFHFAHIFLSAITTTAIFLWNERHLGKAIAVGYFATLIACGLSDLFLPYLGGLLLGAPMHLHICLLDDPLPVLLSNTSGIAIGAWLGMKRRRISYVSHGSHVFISSFASLFYLVSFGVDNWLTYSAGLFIITILAVVIPCCSSDIVIPLSFISGLHGHEHQDEHTSLDV